MGKYTSDVANVAANAIRTGASADAAVAAYRKANNLDSNDNPLTVTFYRNQYRNRNDNGTHWGHKVYKTAKGAAKNRKNPAFLRTAVLTSTSFIS